MKLKLDAVFVKQLFQYLSKGYKDVFLTPKSEDIEIFSIDDGRIALFLLKLDKRDCLEYSVSNEDLNREICLDPRDILTKVNKLRKGDVIEFNVDMKSDKKYQLNIIRKKGRKSQYNLYYAELFETSNLKVMKVLELEYKLVFNIDMGEFNDICDEGFEVSEALTFKASPNSNEIIFKAEPLSEINTYNTSIKLEKPFITNNLTKNVEATYPFHYLRQLKNIKIQGNSVIDVSFHEQIPINFKVHVKEHSLFSVSIAPNIEEK